MKISNNFDRWMFDYKEGNLSAAEAEEFENFLIQHPEFEVDADAWDMAYVQSEPVIYPHAEKLEKKRRVAGWYYWSAAASLLLLLGSTTIYFFGDSEQALENSMLSNSKRVVFSQLTSDNQTQISAYQRSSSLLSSITNGTSDYTSGSYVTGSMPVYTNSTSSGNIAENTSNTNTELSSGNKQYGSDENLLAVENAKLKGDNNIGKYAGNPESKNLSFDVSKKSSAKSGSGRGVVKKFYRRVEKMLGYPPGLTNLRDPELILPQNTLLAFNSSFTGGMLKSRFEMNYRNQWLGTDQASQELNISYDNYSYGLRGGVGILVNAQDYGMGQFGDYNMSLLYSPKLVINRNTVIEPSVKFTMGSLIANGTSLTADSDFEMDRGRLLQVGSADQLNGVSRQWYKDYGLGIMLNTKWFYAGFNADNLNGHYENVYGNDLTSPTKSPIKLSAVIGTDYKSNKKTMIFSPFIAYQQYGKQPEFWGGLNYRQGFFMIGGAMSTKQEFTASVGMKFEGFKLVYHYDYTESLLTQNRMGSHNIGVRFNAKRKTQRLTH
ncbi:MAG: type IX secretion system membrane protein PorP/SprF [Crocinitomicaceae bacterium]|nr:type IX secretion system membrane protein PorP/SprF [Crocinitomicaceae bacterium]